MISYSTAFGMAAVFLLLGVFIGYATAPTYQPLRLSTVACEAAGGFVATRARDWLTRDAEEPQE